MGYSPGGIATEIGACALELSARVKNGTVISFKNVHQQTHYALPSQFARVQIVTTYAPWQHAHMLPR